MQGVSTSSSCRGPEHPRSSGAGVHVGDETVRQTALTLVVEVGDLRVGLPAGVVDEVLRMVAVDDLPGAPGSIAGLVDRRGQVVPVLDLRRRFGLPAFPPALDDRLVVVTAAGSPLLLWVDAVLGLEQVDADAIRALPSELTSGPHLAGVARIADGLLYVHEPDRFLSDHEAAELGAVLAAVMAGAS